MKKLNKKGFTLIELLAVIVVLAIIMVIATQQINGTIKRTRADSLVSSMDMAVKQAKTKIIDGSLDVGDDLSDVVDYNKSEYTYSVTKDTDGNYVITLSVPTSGDSKFKTVKWGEDAVSSVEKKITSNKYSIVNPNGLKACLDTNGDKITCK